MNKRKAIRAYLERPVDRATVHRIIDAARRAPSGANTQPWEIAVVTGETRGRLLAGIEAAYRRGEPGTMDYQYYPNRWGDQFNKRRIECGRLLYEALDIAREDKEKRKE